MASPSAMVTERLFETFIPGFSIASRTLDSVFHIDLSNYLQYLIGVAAVFVATKYVLEGATLLLWRYFSSTVDVGVDDEVYNYVMYWLSRQPFSNNTPSFSASSRTELDFHSYLNRGRKSHSDDGYDSDIGSDEDFDTYWERTKRRGKLKQLHFTPSIGSHYFRYKGRLLKFNRSKQKLSAFTFSDHVSISCLGWDTSFLKELLEEAQQEYIRRDGDKTIIYRSAKGSKGEDSNWSRCMARHPRPMSTVVLDSNQKQDFMQDVKDYLHPFTRRWYANRGIPYRRGYLFHGPPGCGKTSLCFAAAGDLGLKIYIINLNSRNLTEEGLASLFSSLPARCMVLLEDIDTAGVITNNRADSNSDGTATTGPAAAEAAIKTAAKEGKAPSAQAADQSRPGVSLSGLLNTIDGIASSEGRILVMTTNHIENLDPALLRPGRVDMTIRFEYADTNALQDLYRTIYTKLDGDIKYSTRQRHGRSGSKAKSMKDANGKANCNVKVAKHDDASVAQVNGVLAPSSNASTPHNTTLTPHQKQAPGTGIHRHSLSPADIDSLAIEFASRIPAGKFTPAEIQGYLLRHKYSPHKAVEGVEEWVNGFVREGDGGVGSEKNDKGGKGVIS
ncbi:hypothetical protein AJ79_01892 [Helicocarpus griseus UAMH5409]|uniref:AAA+ ATPase domain-containing protein n=1 Tax=Helicocarpus griseus UAMH5409 TaxID=1447875 RepID=A0A2B7Y4K3_9EURO|nr:hypothetical protein AJ79_01892 [Helicocarpus griseus UAMH5409]